MAAYGDVGEVDAAAESGEVCLGWGEGDGLAFAEGVCAVPGKMVGGWGSQAIGV